MGARKKPRKRTARGRRRSASLLRRLFDPTTVAWLSVLAGAGSVAFILWPAARAARTDTAALAAPVPTPRARPSSAAAPIRPRVTPQAEPPERARPARPDAAAPGPLRRPRGPLERPRIAIILDDLGNELGIVKEAATLPYSITFSVIPHLRYSREAAELLHARGYELMLHLPMEAEDPSALPGEGAVLVRMDPPEVQRVVQGDLASVPHIKGVNNHMGSRVTADPARMRWVLNALRSSQYYFIDSRTTPRTVAYRIAREMQIPCAERDIFIDNIDDAGAITRQLEQLLERARHSGQAVGIGHIRPTTIESLRRWLPGAERRGAVFVYASALVS